MERHQAEADRTGMTRPWDGFLDGPENALAHAGVMALARGEREGVSPLVVHGPAGVGKSRLLSGLVGEWLERRPEDAVAHLPAEVFAGACAGAASQPGPEGWNELRDRFRGVELFVLEDLHALERATLAQEELSRTLDELDRRGASVAVSARTGPGQWNGSGWPRRLVNRLAGGLAVRVDPPGLASRRRFVLEQSRRRALRLPADVVEDLAASADGYRALEGLIARLALDARLDRRSIIARRHVEEIQAEAGPGAAGATPSIEQINRAVAQRFGVRPRDLRSASRRQALVHPRHLAMYLARLHTGQSFASIGAYFGKRDSKTVQHACQMARRRLVADPALAAAFDAIGGRWHQLCGQDSPVS